jgi:hypothetical protein
MLISLDDEILPERNNTYPLMVMIVKKRQCVKSTPIRPRWVIL